MSPNTLHYPQQCHHIHNIPLSKTCLYSLAISSFFILSLYAFVPSSVRRLPRDNVLHIQWRSGVILAVMIVAVGMYPLLFCHWHNSSSISSSSSSSMEDSEDTFRDDDGSNITGGSPPSWYRYLGLSFQPIQDLKIILHVTILYLGSTTCTLLKIYHYARILHYERGHTADSRIEHLKYLNDRPENRNLLPKIIKLKYLAVSFNVIWIQPTLQSFRRFFGVGDDDDNEEYRWRMLRNLAIAPFAEEVVFRACLIPPLLVSCYVRTSTKSSVSGSAVVLLTPVQVSWIAPLFFGVAHLHHFYEQYRQLPLYRRTKSVLLQLTLGLVVQWTYTTLFGAYVSHVFLRTGSLCGVVLAHVFCNYMGLPNVSFAHPSSDLYGYRWFVVVVYIVGIVGFGMGFSSVVLFPRESLIPALLLRGTSR